VVALDVGHGQLHPRIRGDERVEVIERFNVRALTSEHLATAPSMIVADVSFISLTRVIPALVGVAAPRADLVLLVKPQFEAGRRDVAKGHGVITDPAIHTRVRDEIGETLERSGCTVVGWCDSPITGADGNHEFLVHATVGEEVSAG
jgi:23S rRNA (cytidine1920-2'-O)/16S rRNA (cytidine1409-2'-O)-methyltransferase